jgi:predicted naringenin-chalcone synthase
MRQQHVVISGFSQVLPEHRLGQRELVDWLVACHGEAERCRGDQATRSEIAERFAHYAVSDQHIRERYMECGDMASTAWGTNWLYHPHSERPHAADALARNHFFAEKTEQIFRRFYEKAAKPDHIIHVTCTGYVSPSAPQRLIGDPAWNHRADVTHAYHMGCYASLPAVRMGEASVIAFANQGRAAVVDIVHTEICSLHLNPGNYHAEQILVQTLFGDGHIKYSVTPDDGDHAGLRVLAIQEHIIPDSERDITWTPSAGGTVMTLAKDVPHKISAQLKNFVDGLCEAAGGTPESITQQSIFAVHPGGPKIVEAAGDALGLRDEQLRSTRRVLLERGNMSSATLPHVWQDILTTDPPPGTTVVSLAFGPGLTVFGAVFEVV